MADEMMSEEVVQAETDTALEDLSWDNIEEVSAPIEAEESDDDAEEVEAKSESDESEADEDDSESDSEDVETVEEKVDDKDDEEEEEEEESKSLSLSELGDDEKITVKIDGELEEISIKEFKSGISGQKALARKWTEVDREHKKNQSDIADINKYVSTFSEKMKSGGALDAMSYLGSFSGMGPHQIKASLIKSLMPEIERMGLLSQSEIDLEYQKAENSFMKESNERNNAISEQKQTEENFNKLISDTKAAHNIEDSEWTDAISYLDKHLDAGEPITPELVTDYVKYDRASGQAETLLNVEGENLNNEDNIDVMTQIILDNPSFTKEDLEEVVREGLAIAKKEAIEKKVAKKVTKSKKSKTTKTTKEARYAAPEDEYGEEVESLYDL